MCVEIFLTWYLQSRRKRKECASICARILLVAHRTKYIFKYYRLLNSRSIMGDSIKAQNASLRSLVATEDVLPWPMQQMRNASQQRVLCGQSARRTFDGLGSPDLPRCGPCRLTKKCINIDTTNKMQASVSSQKRINERFIIINLFHSQDEISLLE